MTVPKNPVAVPALNLKAQYQAIRDEIEPIMLGLFESQMFVMGPEVEKLEAELAEYCGVARGIGCASGTDALLLPLMARGIGPGDEVITSPYTFFATAGSIWRTGAKPVFVDIESESYNIDPTRIEAAITPRTRAIIPVHLYGQAADMEPIREIAAKHGLFVLEDAAQAIAAAYKGQRAGRLGDAAALSFYPSKNLGGFGDAGMIVTDDPVLGRSMARLRVHGMEPKYYHHEVGINSRLDAIQAAVCASSCAHLDEWTTKRRDAASRYRGLFKAHGLNNLVGLTSRARRLFPCVQPVRHPCASSAPRPATRVSDGAPDRHGDLLSHSAAFAALLSAIGPQAGRFSRGGIGCQRNAGSADLSRAQRRTTAICGRLGPPVPRRPRACPL